MDAALLVVVIVSLAAALGFAAVAWRSVDEERRRSAARVAALSAAIESQESHLKVAPTAAAPTTEATIVGAGLSRLDDGPVTVGSMFDAKPGATVESRPMIKAAVMAAMAVALVVFAAASTRDAVEPSMSAEASAPLELISMRHTREGSALTVSGLVRNPRQGATVGRIAAVVLAFDRQGTFVATATAPLDFISLAPGDESPFVVTLPNVSEVGRYRVSFRTDAGVVRHVDRRAAQVASNLSAN
jgi:hypothetical protein